MVFFVLFLMCCGVVNAQPENFVDYGNGVLYFINAHEWYSGVGAQNPTDFGLALSQYLANHPDKHVVSMVEDGSAGYGETSGFYVIVENKTIAVPTPSISMNCSPTWNGTRVGTTALADYQCVVSNPGN
jgi:hypothetical protein